jgi:N-acetylmuramoyl-L-alanine amidase
MNIIDNPSPNFEERRNGEKPSLIILHFTGCESADHALKTLTDPNNPKGRVSAHYMIHEDGTIFRLVDESKKAWHAGAGSWQGRTDDLNSASIGIELSNRRPKNADGTLGPPNPYTKEQLASLTALCHDIMRRHKIPAYNIIGHSDIAPDRKQDPGYHFPWRDLAKQGIGVMPKLSSCESSFNAAATAQDERALKSLFARAGYALGGFGEGRPVPTTTQLISAFQQHYEPEIYKKPNGTPGIATEKTVTMLQAVADLNEKKRTRQLVFKP